MLGIAILEGIMSLIGLALSDMIDSFIPDLDLSEDVFALSKFFSWIKIKQVPIIILFVILLTVFSLLGLFSQYILFSIFNSLLSQWILFLPVFLTSLVFLRIIAVFLAKKFPKDNTSSISKNDLIGHIATITLGTAVKGSPAEAKAKDKYGQMHYLMIEPENEGCEFTYGQSVLILGKIKSHFYASNEIPNKLK